MFLPPQFLTLLTPVALVASALGIAAALPSASLNQLVGPADCDAPFVSLVVRNGQDQYFACSDSGGELRQTFSSKNPWVINPSAPALFAQPAAAPSGAVGNVFTGTTQGVGVNSAGETGAKRDSISGSETLTLTTAASLNRSLERLSLGVKVIANNTQVRVQAVDRSGTPILGAVQTLQRNQGAYALEFFSSARVAGAAGFAISAARGEFSIDGTQATRFWFDTSAPAGVSGLTVVPSATEVTLSWTNPSDSDLAAVVIERSGTTIATLTNAETTFTDSGLEPGTQYSYSVFTRDTSGNASAAETVSVTTLEVFENGGDTSPVVDYDGSSIQATFDGGADCPISADNPLPYTLDLDDPANIGVGDSEATVAFDFTVVPGNQDITGCRFTLEVFSPTTEILDLLFDPDGPGTVFPAPVEQLRCVEGVSPTPGSAIDGEPNTDVSCIESMTLANDIVVFDDDDPSTPDDVRDGQQFILTGFFDARGFLK